MTRKIIQYKEIGSIPASFCNIQLDFKEGKQGKKRSDDFHHPFPQQCLSFLLTTEGIVNIDKISGQFVKALIHHPEKDVEVMNTVEDKRLVFLEIFDIL